MPDVMFTGPEGRLEGRYHQSKEERAPIALILHPHPQYGGTMNHKVVFSLFHVFVNRGFSVLRFNTRGVGRSQGRFDNGMGELSDAAGVEAQHREAAVDEHMEQRDHDLVVHRPAILRVRMEDQRDRRVFFFALVIAALEASLGTGEHHIRHLDSDYAPLLAALDRRFGSDRCKLGHES